MSNNYARFVGATVQSMLDQTYRTWEAVIVDDGSTDDSLEVLHSFSDPRLRVHSFGENRGAGHAYNFALALCRGAYVGSVDADDLMEPSRLERQVDVFERRPELDLLATHISVIDDDGALIEDHPSGRWVNLPRSHERVDSWVFNPFCHSSVLLRKDAHDRVGGVNTDLRFAPDTELWTRCFTHGLRADVVAEPLTRYRVHANEGAARYDEARVFLELAYILSAHLAPALVRGGRNDLLAHAVTMLASRVGDESSEAWTAAVAGLREKIGWSGGFKPFAASFASGCGESWPLLEEATRKAGRLQFERTSPPRPSPRRHEPRRLAVIDDYFPDLATAFRVAEFNHYLENFDCEVFSTNPNFTKAWEGYAERYPALAPRVKPLTLEGLEKCSAAYFVFLGNAYRHLRLVESLGLPFAFTLYPGGGFEMHSPTVDLMLESVSRSPNLKRVLMNQHATRDYLLGRGLCEDGRDELIWGLPVPPGLLALPERPRRRFPRDKDTLDICFTAHRYMPGGIDKGYDAFTKVAAILARESPIFRFHAVGGMGPGDVPLGSLEDRFTFHTPQMTEFFPSFYAGIDAILSPNRPFILRPGSFDGFPTGCCVEAALCGVALYCTDLLDENRYFRPDEEICIVPPDPVQIAERLLACVDDPDRLYAMGEAGRRKCRELYATRRQLGPRQAILEEILAGGTEVRCN